MPTANERRALWFLAAVALSGSVVRVARSRGPAPAADTALERQLGRVDAARDRRGEQARRPADPRPRPARAQPRPTGVVDLNTASAGDIEDLPGIGPALAARIVAARDSLHGFRALDALCGVRGIGPALIERLRPRVTLSGEQPALKAPCPGSRRAAPKPAASRRPKAR
jgi:competence ComEA-like helix-hairpin-helix protein